MGNPLILSDDTETAWIEQARRLAAFKCEVTFGIQPGFSIGPAKDITAADWEAAHVRLPPFDLPLRFADRITTAELLGHEASLIEYYRQVVTLAERHRKRSLLRPFSYFRREPAIIADGALATEFLWNDNVDETQAVLTAFVEAGARPDRLVHCDVDQGEGDPGGGERVGDLLDRMGCGGAAADRGWVRGRPGGAGAGGTHAHAARARATGRSAGRTLRSLFRRSPRR